MTAATTPRAVPYGTPGSRYMQCAQHPWPLSLPYRVRQEADWLASELIVDPHSDEWSEVEHHMGSRRALLALLQGDAEAARFALLDAVAYRAGERLDARAERARDDREARQFWDEERHEAEIFEAREVRALRRAA